MTTLLAAAVPAFTALMVYEKLSPATKLLPLALFEMRTFGLAIVTVALDVTFGV